MNDEESHDARHELERALAKPADAGAEPPRRVISIDRLASIHASERLIAQHMNGVSDVAAMVNGGIKIPAFDQLKKLDIGGMATKQMFAQSGSLSNVLKLMAPAREHGTATNKMISAMGVTPSLKAMDVFPTRAMTDIARISQAAMPVWKTSAVASSMRPLRQVSLPVRHGWFATLDLSTALIRPQPSPLRVQTFAPARGLDDVSVADEVLRFLDTIERHPSIDEAAALRDEVEELRAQVESLRGQFVVDQRRDVPIHQDMTVMGAFYTVAYQGIDTPGLLTHGVSGAIGIIGMLLTRWADRRFR